MSDDRDEAAITTPAGSVSYKGKRMAEFITVISLCVLGIMAYVLYDHKNDAKESNTLMRDAIKEMTTAQKDGVAAQREMNCLISVAQDQRERNADLCKRLAR